MQMTKDHLVADAERSIAAAAVDALLAAGFSIRINDGEDDVLLPSRDRREILAAMFSTGEDWLHAGDAHEGLTGWVKLIYGNGSLIYSNGGWDVMSDYTANLAPWIGAGTAVEVLSDAWDKAISGNGPVPQVMPTDASLIPTFVPPGGPMRMKNVEAALEWAISHGYSLGRAATEEYAKAHGLTVKEEASAYGTHYRFVPAEAAQAKTPAQIDAEIDAGIAKQLEAYPDEV